MINGKPDEIDIKLLGLLQQDASVDIAKLAKLVHRSANPVHERIKKLRQAGYIKAYIAVLDRALAGQPVLVIVHVKLKRQTQMLLGDFEQTVTRMTQVQFCLHVSGGWDFILHVTATTPQAYYVFLMERICGQPNVEHVESSFVMKECKSYSPLVV
ncbi:Lrp/AsnC family transcriptional regulator [Mucilaginibacter sp. R-33]|uniref:Lrp/AsnC family transcriptional regulator n=1 Tax=Mucilaginibacter sp. R-33 TaxID=3416711 RepID=UPI003CEBB964